MITQKVLNTIRKYDMLRSGESVVIGLSGGKDSVTLAKILSELSDELGITLCAVHINHNLRGEEAKRDENFVRSFCETNKIELKVFSFDVKAIAVQKHLGLEECGRELRYEAFSSMKCDKIATAHTLSDSTETMLFNLARGSGIKGICGIPPTRENVIRPLIECTTDEVLDYLKANKIDFVNDSSNDSLEYSRNILRHKVIPELKKINSSFEYSAGRLTEILRDDADFIHCRALEEVEKCKVNGGYDARKISLLHNALKSEAIKIICEEETGVIPEYFHNKKICELLNFGGSLQINGGVILRVRKNILDFPEKLNTDSFLFEIEEGKRSIPNGEIEVSVKNCEQFENLDNKVFSFAVDYDKIKGKLICRSRKAGDSFYDGKRKCTKKLKDFFNENGIKPESRDSYPVFELNGEVIGTIGSAPQEKYRVDKGTKRVLYICYRRKNN